MATRVAQKRLSQEYQSIHNNPTEYVDAHPDESNILTWYYVVTGPPDTPYAGGQYMGTLEFPPDYPFKPPAIRMITPSGRFEPNMRLCLSISDYHPDTWNPAWSVSTILVGLLSFMTSEEVSTGALKTLPEHRKRCAQQSHAWNLKHPQFCAQFPDLAAKAKAEQASAAAKVQASAEKAGATKSANGQQTILDLESSSSGSEPGTPADVNTRDPNALFYLGLAIVAGALMYAMIVG